MLTGMVDVMHRDGEAICTYRHGCRATHHHVCGLAQRLERRLEREHHQPRAVLIYDGASLIQVEDETPIVVMGHHQPPQYLPKGADQP